MNYKLILAYLTIGIYAFAIGYLSGIIGVLEFILSLCIYTLLFYFGHYLLAKYRNKPIMYLTDFINYFFKRVSVFLLFITVLFSTGAYLLNEVYPAPMPEYTLTNGEKTVKFQAMSHIGTRNFYDTIIANLIKHKQNGGVYFYEGVGPGSEENLEKFNQAIGIEFDENLYKNFSKLYGVVNQDNREFIGLVNNKDFNVDLNMDQIVELYEQRMKTFTGEVYENKLPIDANKTIVEALAGLNDKQLKLLVYINQAILNFIIGSDSTQNFLTNNFANKELFEVILHERNLLLATTIAGSKHEDIYVTYGLLHYKGVLELLKWLDPRWQEVGRVNYYPIKN